MKSNINKQFFKLYDRMKKYNCDVINKSQLSGKCQRHEVAVSVFLEFEPLY